MANLNGHDGQHVDAADLAVDYDHCAAIAEHIQRALPGIVRPQVLIICGSGLGSLADDVTDALGIDYRDIPGFPVGNVVGHRGRLLFGMLAGSQVMCMQGRVHPYEGKSLAECTLPIRVARILGVTTVLMTSAVGGINKTLRRGDLMLLNDHICVPALALKSPLVGPNDSRFGPRFLSSVNMYDRQLRKMAHRVADATGGPLRDGVYAMVGGPQFESPAEIRWLAAAGADVVGMSVAHETLTARHCGMRVLAIALVTNLSEHNTNGKVQVGLHEEVLEMGRLAASRTAALIKALLPELDTEEPMTPTSP